MPHRTIDPRRDASIGRCFDDAGERWCDPADTQQPRRLASIEGLGEIVTLNDTTAPALQQLELGKGLHPFDDDLDIEFPCKAERCPNYGIVPRFDADVLDEGLGDLDPV